MAVFRERKKEKKSVCPKGALYWSIDQPVLSGCDFDPGCPSLSGETENRRPVSI